MESCLQHSYSHHPACSLEPAPLSLSLSIFLFISPQSLSSLQLFSCPPYFLFKSNPTCPPPELTGRDEPFEAHSEEDWARPRHWQSSEAQQGCGKLNIEWLFDDVTSLGSKERKTEKLQGLDVLCWAPVQATYLMLIDFKNLAKTSTWNVAYIYCRSVRILV